MMAAERPVLIVDDDPALRATLVEQLSVDGEFVAAEAGCIAEADDLLAVPTTRFDAVILDVGLPDGDGRDYCVQLRRRGHRMPVIMLTGSSAETDVVRGLDAGANDYISKPFRLAELLARLRAQLRSFESSEDAVFAIGPYMFRPSAKLLQDQMRGKRIRLTEKEAAILKFLYRVGDACGGATGAAERGVGLQCLGHHAHAGDAYLSVAAEDRTRSGECAVADHRRWGLSIGSRGIRNDHRRLSGSATPAYARGAISCQRGTGLGARAD